MLTNADTPEDAAVARANGAEGIGLVRSEHMFFGEAERIAAVRKMIMAGDATTRKAALDEILPFMQSDFEGTLGWSVLLNPLPLPSNGY